MPKDVPKTLPNGFSVNDFMIIRTLREEGILVDVENNLIAHTFPNSTRTLHEYDTETARPTAASTV